MDLAIIGLPRCGKTTLFSSLALGHGGKAGHEENIAVVKIPDERLERLAELLHPKKVGRAELRLHDLPAPFQPGVALDPAQAASLAGADVLVHVVRAFHRDDVPHPQSSIDPERDIVAMDLELIYHDLGIVERRLERLEAGMRGPRSEREAAERELVLLRYLKEYLEDELPLRNKLFTPQELKQLSGYGLLTLKPMLLVINIDEADSPRIAEIESDFRARYAASGGKTTAATVCVQLERELVELPEEEASQFRQELGTPEAAAPRILGLAFGLLDLITFYTVVGEECRAWAVPKGTTAHEAAAKIHSDMERGFIRAEAIAYDQLLELGTLAEAKKRGLLRSEGKQYVVRDGDVLHILFHV